MQLGWADGSFAGHCNSDRGDGCGDGPSSWAFDGWRRYKWHSTATEWGCRWKEGDVVGCLVDLDEMIVSFTLNGMGNSIGMGVAFSGEGFRPSGGVYACVSFNRREKLRLILGGKCSEPFKHTPPPGYRGVGEAVLEAADELDGMLQKESVLDPFPSSNPVETRKFICDFSGGEHGHELMASSHRYYGSDASVHLGSGRPKLPSSSSKASSPTPSSDVTSEVCLANRLKSEWSKCKLNTGADQLKSKPTVVIESILTGYKNVQRAVTSEAVNESIVIALLLARKLLLHIMVTMGQTFDSRLLVPTSESDGLSCARLFWNVVDSCVSLRSSGWVGEAGAMAIAAEALGLGISSNDHVLSRNSTSVDRSGASSSIDLDEWMYLPAPGISQLLSSVVTQSPVGGAVATGDLLAAGSEAAIGSDSGGLLTFLRESLQGATRSSSELRKILVAFIRKSVRVLSVVEYEGDTELSEVSEVRGSYCMPESVNKEQRKCSFSHMDFIPQQDEDDSNRNGTPGRTTSNKSMAEDASPTAVFYPDARLVAFLTGLLLTNTPPEDANDTASELVEAWSVGLLSASLPWKMICGFTVAGVLNQIPSALSTVLLSSRTLARYYGRLPNTVARRIFAERAASPVCSRYVQSMIELLAAVKRSIPHLNSKHAPDDFTKFWSHSFVDAATPRPLIPILSEPSKGSSTWEAEEGWISSDTGWEIWTGTVEYLVVDWKPPSRSAVRALMDSGQVSFR